MKSFWRKLQTAANLGLTRTILLWSFSTYLLLTVLGAAFWPREMSFVPVIFIALIFSLQLIGSSINNAWHGGKLNEISGWVNPPTMFNWRYIIVEMTITVLTLLGTMSMYLDWTTTLLITSAVLLSGTFAYFWRNREQIFTKTSNKNGI